MSKKGNAQEETVRSYKGFTHGMTSIYNFQYEEGKSYETERAEVRASGFHASPYPPSCFPTYPPGYSVYHLVQQSGEFSSDDEMTASTKISIGKKMDGNGLACAAVDYTMENIKESMPPHDPETKDFVGTSAIGARKVSCTGGDRSLSSSIDGMASAAVAMGHCSCSSLEGRNGVAAAVGQYGTSYARGPRNISAATNLYGISATKGQHAVAVASHHKSMADADGYSSVSVAMGDESASFVNGERSVAVTAGREGASTSGKGHHAVSVNTGQDGRSCATGKNSVAVSTGESGTASVVGAYSASVSAGDFGSALSDNRYCITASTGAHGCAEVRGKNSLSAAIGEHGTSTATGVGSVAVAVGANSMASTDGAAIAAAFGHMCAAKGGVGSWLVLTEWHSDGVDREIKEVRAVYVDGEKILPNRAYALRKGEVVLIDKR